jgi:hypothetical protein
MGPYDWIASNLINMTAFCKREQPDAVSGVLSQCLAEVLPALKEISGGTHQLQFVVLPIKTLKSEP